jgi:DNA polymerase-3 subunit delta
MKLTSAQLEPHLAKTLGKVYLVCSDEPFLAQEALNVIREKAAAAGFSERLRLDIESESDLDQIYSHAYTPPLFGSKRLIELYWKGDKLSKGGQQFLQQYGLKPSPHSILVSRLGKLDSKTEQTQWYKALDKVAVVISIWPLAQNQLPAWIQQRARANNLRLTPDAAQLLAHSVEGNLQAAAQEIEKLSLLDLPSLDRATLETFIVDQGCFSAFDLVDQAVAGNGSQVLRILQYLQREGAEPLMILGAFTFELRTLVKLAKELKKGASLNALFSQYRVRMSKQPGIREFFKRGSEELLWSIFLKAGEIDRLVKGASQGDVWLALEELSLAVAGIVPRLSSTGSFG